MKRFSCAGILLALVLYCVNAAAAGSGSLRGAVTDPLGAVIPGATVQLFQENKLIATTRSNAQGVYEFTGLEAGRYRVGASAPGFETQQSAAVYVGSGKSAALNLALRLGVVPQKLVVSATGTGVPESQVGASVSVIPSDEFENKLEASEGLRLVPGVQVLQTGPRGLLNSVFIRGGNSNANKVLIDGVPANQVGGIVEFGNIFETGVDNIEVLRGPNSVLYGSDALAGVISVTTRRGSTPLPQLTYDLDGGNFNTMRQAGSIGGAWSQLDYFSEFSRFDTGNSLPNSAFHNATYAGNFGLSPNSRTELRVTIRHSASNSGDPNTIDFFGIPDDSFQKEHNTYLSITAQNQTTSHWHNLLRYGQTRLNFEFDNPTPTGIPFDPFGTGPNFLGKVVTIRGANGFSVTGQAILDFAGVFPQQSFTTTHRDFVQFQSDYAFSPSLTALFGFRADDERQQPVKHKNLSYTGELHGNLRNRLYLTAGGGVEDNTVFGTAATPRLSAAYYLARPRTDGLLNGTRLSFNYGQGIKEPDPFSESSSLFDLLSQVPGGSQQLSQFHIGPIGPERSRSLDAAIEQFAWNGRARLGATFFHNRFNDQIEFVPPQALIQLGVPAAVVGNTPFGAAVNSEATRAAGVETALELNLGHGFMARGSYTYLDAVVKRSFSSDELFPSINPAFPDIPIGAFSPLVGNRPFRRAPHSGNFLLSYSRPRLTLNLSGSLVGRRDDSTLLSDQFFGPGMLLPNRNLDGAYQKLDFGGTYQLRRYLTWYASIENLLSERYEALAGFPALPLTVRTGVRITLGGESWRLK